MFGTTALPVTKAQSATTPPAANAGRIQGDLGCYASLYGDPTHPTPDDFSGNELKLGPAITYYICVASRYVTVIAVFIIIVVGIMYIIGGFKPDMASTAKTILGTTITGLVFMYLTTFIINLLVVGGIVGRAT